MNEKPPPFAGSMFHPTLYRIERCTDTFVDACLRDEAGRLLLMSVFGRDTAIKELQARIHLGTQHQDGLGEMVLKPVEDVGSRLPQRVTVANPKELEKLTGRLPGCVYGNLTHMWLYNRVLRMPQRGADVAWIVVRTPSTIASEESLGNTHALMRERIWAAVSHLAAIPLLDHWKVPVTRAIGQDGMVLTMGERGNDQVHPTLSAPVGGFQVCKVQLRQDRLAAIVTDMVRRGVLTLQPQPVPCSPELPSQQCVLTSASVASPEEAMA